MRTWEGWHHHLALSLLAVWFLIGETHRGQQLTPALTLPQVRYGLSVLMLIKTFDSRQMEAYLDENVVARVFIGRHRDAQAQIRDRSNIARAYTALGKAGFDEADMLIAKEAYGFGFVDERVLSADTTAQDLPIGHRPRQIITIGLQKLTFDTLSQNWR